jgi:chemotaxis response regulator CheB
VGWKTAYSSEEVVIESIRIVLADMPQLAADMLERAIVEQSDMVIVARPGPAADLSQVTRMTAPDIVVVGLTEPDLPAQWLDLFTENMGLTVLGVQKRRGVAYLYQLQPYQLELGDVAPEDLVSEIRTAVATSPLSKWRAIPPSQP